MRRLQVLVSLIALAASGLLACITAPPAGAATSAIVNLGGAPALGSLPPDLNAPLVGIAAHPSAAGYWAVGGDGGVFTFGQARFYGSTGAMTLVKPVVDIAATPTGRGYWLVAEDGGVFSFGDARFYGSTGGLSIGTTIVGIAATPTGRGYALAGADGRVFSFGDAPRVGGGPLSLAAPIAGIEATPSGAGLWLVGSDGAVFTFGDARYHGGVNPFPIVAAGIARTADGRGYWMAVNAPESSAPPNSGSGRRIVYSNSEQRVWLVESSGRVAHTWFVSGRKGVPAPGLYHVFSKSPASSAGSLRLPWMSRFARARTGLAIGFHGIPLRPDGSPIQTDAELGQYRSHGCVRMNQQAVKVLYDWAPIGTPVVVLP